MSEGGRALSLSKISIKFVRLLRVGFGSLGGGAPRRRGGRVGRRRRRGLLQLLDKLRRQLPLPPRGRRGVLVSVARTRFALHCIIVFLFR